VSDPGARVWDGPTPVRRVAHAMAVSVDANRSLDPLRTSLACTRGSRLDCPDDLGSRMHEVLANDRDSYVTPFGGKYCRRLRASSRRTPCPDPRAEDDDDPNHCRCAGHHAIDAWSVLGAVQGSSLRSDRAHARPTGLDGACAQTAVLAIARWPAARTLQEAFLIVDVHFERC
jgi:hypothetical protein